MLLIRGFNEEQYAKEIKTGKIGFRDLLTTLLYPENNGYRFSDYYEKAIIEAAVEASPFELDLKNTPANIANIPARASLLRSELTFFVIVIVCASDLPYRFD